MTSIDGSNPPGERLNALTPAQRTGGAGAKNSHDSREAWLRDGADKLRTHFTNCGHELPSNIRFSIAFPSTGRKGKRLSECWQATASADAHYEIFIRADLADPVRILAMLTKELIHTTLPPGTGHGVQFKTAAIKIGFLGPMRKAVPGVLLESRLIDLAAKLGPLPHARLDIEQGASVCKPLDLPKKQRARLLKAECGTAGCGYNVRIVAKWVRDVGPPACPKHGPMRVDWSPESATGDENAVAPATAQPPSQVNNTADTCHGPETSDRNEIPPSDIQRQPLVWRAAFKDAPEPELRNALKRAGGTYDSGTREWRGTAGDIESLRAAVLQAGGQFEPEAP